MADLQNFSVPADNTVEVVVDISSDFIDSLEFTEITWSVWSQEHGVRIPDEDPILSKTVGHGIAISISPAMRLTITIDADDTKDLLGNFYHEIQIIDEEDEKVTTTQGIMTVTDTGVRP